MTVMLVVLSAAAEAGAMQWPDPKGKVWIMPPEPDGLASHLNTHPSSAVVVLTQVWDVRAARLAVTVAVGAHPATRFALRAASASVLALAAVGRQAAHATTEPADVVRLVDEQLARTVSGAWLRRVSNLHEPAPSLWQRLRSMLPGGPGFVATFGADQQVTSAPVAVPPHATLLVAATDPQPAARLIGRSDAIAVAPPVSAERAYGSPGAEFVALVQPPVLAPARAVCRVCGQGGDGPFCQFCHIVLTGQDDAA